MKTIGACWNSLFLEQKQTMYEIHIIIIRNIYYLSHGYQASSPAPGCLLLQGSGLTLWWHTVAHLVAAAATRQTWMEQRKIHTNKVSRLYYTTHPLYIKRSLKSATFEITVHTQKVLLSSTSYIKIQWETIFSCFRSQENNSTVAMTYQNQGAWQYKKKK